MCALLPLVAVQAEQRDPFQPALWANSKDKESLPSNNKNFKHQLENYSLNVYAVVGVVISEEMAMTVIKSPDGKDHFLNIGDRLGSEGGHIETISSEGITVNTESSLITIPVSNKIEIKANGKNN